MSYYIKNKLLSASNQNSANYTASARWNFDLPLTFGGATSVGTNGRSSAYGAFDQSGNGREWTDTLINSNGWRRVNRGGIFSGVKPVSKLVSISSAGRILVSTNTSAIISPRLGCRIASDNNPYEFNNFVSVVDSGNGADITGYGSVNYNFQIGTYELTYSEYCDFLNAIAATDTYNLYPNTLSFSSPAIISAVGYIYFNDIYGITRSGSSGSYTYSVDTNMGNKPVGYMSWFKCARYCNWLHNNKPSGSQNSSTTEDGAYTLNGAINNAELITKNVGAKYWIPTEDEWYKAAFYDPNKYGDGSPGYWLYSTKSDDDPIYVFANNIGDGVVADMLSITKNSDQFCRRVV
jgi:formylglycine-generating enzyme required for sulfatase activity